MKPADLMNRQEIMDLLGIKATAFWRLRKEGAFPVPTVKLTQKIQLWKTADIKAFIDGTWGGNTEHSEASDLSE